MKIRLLALSAAMAVFGLSTVLASETKGPVTDEIGVVVIKKGDPIEIGGIWALTGDAAAIGTDQRRGAELYFDKIHNTILGHEVRLVVEDGLCTAEGGQAAATRLAADPQVVAELGPECSSTATASAPILWNAGISTVATGASAPNLTAPDRPDGLKGFVRTFSNDRAQGVADADYLYEQVGCKRLATIHDGSAYSENLVKVIQGRFKERGGEVVASEAVEPNTVDMRPVLTAIAGTKPCALFYSTFIPVSAQVVRQGKEIGGLEKVPQFGSGPLLAAGYLEAAGKDAVGMRLLIADTSPESLGKDYPEFLKAYEQKYGEKPLSAFHAQSYDGAHLLHLAIESVAKSDAAGNLYIGRKSLLDAYLSHPEFPGLSGAIKCDSYGDCGKFRFAVYEYVSGDPSSFRVSENPKKIFAKQ